MRSLETSINKAVAPSRAKKLSRTPLSRRVDHAQRGFALDQESAFASQQTIAHLTDVISQKIGGMFSHVPTLSAAQPAIDPRKDADKTPVPGSNKRPSPQPSSEPAGMGGGSDGKGGPPKRLDSSELETPEISPAVLKVAEKINNTKELRVQIETPELESGRKWQDGFRHQFWTSDDWEHLRKVQEMKPLGEMSDYHEYYQFLAHSGSYHGGRIALENFAMLLGYPDHQELDDIFRRFVRTRKNGNGGRHDVQWTPLVGPEGAYTQANIIELGPGNGDLIRRLARYERGAEPLKQIGREVEEHEPKKRYGRNYVFDKISKGKELLRNEIDQGVINPTISAIDYVGRFARKLRQSKINGAEGDLESSNEDFIEVLEKAGLTPHSQDVIVVTLVADRADWKKLVQKIKLLAREDGTTRLFFAGTFPFERESDQDTKNENVVSLPNWTDPNDVREQWTANVEIDPDFEHLGEKESVRAQTIHNAICALKNEGIDVYALGEQPYEVYSTHCIVEPAGVIRSQYAHLKERKFMSHELQNMIKRIFDENHPERYADDEVVGIPQEYLLTMMAAHVLPDTE